MRPGRSAAQESFHVHQTSAQNGIDAATIAQKSVHIWQQHFSALPKNNCLMATQTTTAAKDTIRERLLVTTAVNRTKQRHQCNQQTKQRERQKRSPCSENNKVTQKQARIAIGNQSTY
uniref:Uncharacterized protein n=1 Tax=Plectus sambesii TaxID=2011161 RepID=A0A914W506_9BILA